MSDKKRWCVKMEENGKVVRSYVAETATQEEAINKFKDMCKNIITDKTKFTATVYK